MQNPVTGSGGMLVGTVEEVGPRVPARAWRSASAWPRWCRCRSPRCGSTDGLAGWDGGSEQVPADGTAILFARSIVAVLPDDLDAALAMMVMDVCGAPALTAAGRRGGYADGQAARGRRDRRRGQVRLPVARRRPAGRRQPDRRRRAGRDRGDALRAAGLADAVALADARDPVALAAAGRARLGGPADVTVVCVDVPGCEHGAVLATAEGGTVIFFSMATSFSAAALGAEGLAADVTMLVGNGYTPGHAQPRPGPAAVRARRARPVRAAAGP